MKGPGPAKGAVYRRWTQEERKFLEDRRNEYRTDILEQFNARFPPTSLDSLRTKLRLWGIRQDPDVRHERRAKIFRDMAVSDGEVIEMNRWLHIKINGKWAYLHKHRWQEANGPVPDGYHLACIDGNRHNCDPSNWNPLSKPEMMLFALHSPIKPDAADPETREAMITLAKLKSRIREKKK